MEEQSKQMTTFFKCPKCQDREIILFKNENGYDYARPCECKEERQIERLLHGSFITEEFQKLGFKNFNIKDMPPVIRIAYKTTKEYVQEFEKFRRDRENSIALLGNPGSGKTHLLIAGCNNLMRKGVKVQYFPYVEGIKNLNDNFDELEMKLERMRKVDLLFIDDLFKGRERPTEFQFENMQSVINFRYLNHLPILISSERSVDELCEVDEAFGSRIIEMSKSFLVQIKGDRKELNYRLRGLT